MSAPSTPTPNAANSSNLGTALGIILGASFFLAKKSANHSLAWTAVAATVACISFSLGHNTNSFTGAFLVTFLSLSTASDGFKDRTTFAENVIILEKVTALFSSAACVAFLFKR